MITIKNEKELNKFKKVEENAIIYEFDEDVVFDFKQKNMLKKYDEIKDEKLKDCKTHFEKVMVVLEEKFRPRIIYKGQNMTFNKDVDWIDKLELKGDLICKGDIKGLLFYADGNVEAKKIICERLCCVNLTGNYVSIKDLFCKGDVNCEMLKIEHITSCERLKAGVMTFDMTTLYNVSAIGENLNIKK